MASPPIESLARHPRENRIHKATDDPGFYRTLSPGYVQLYLDNIFISRYLLSNDNGPDRIQSSYGGTITLNVRKAANNSAEHLLLN